MTVKQGSIVLGLGPEQITKKVLGRTAKGLATAAKVLLIDTSTKGSHRQLANVTRKASLPNLFVVHAPRSYDLWSKLGILDTIIQNQKISLVVITSFSAYLSSNAHGMADMIAQAIEYLTLKHGLITLVGYHPDDAKLLGYHHVIDVEHKKNYEILADLVNQDNQQIPMQSTNFETQTGR